MSVSYTHLDVYKRQVVKTAASHAVNIGSNPVRVTIEFQTRCLKFNLVLDKQNARQYNIVCFRAVPDDIELVLIRMRVHPFPFRTRKLSSLLPKILAWRRAGKIGNANIKGSVQPDRTLICLLSSVGRACGC